MGRLKTSSGKVYRPLTGIPLLYEDEDTDDMGDSEIHTQTVVILLTGLQIHFQKVRLDLKMRVFSNINVYWPVTQNKGERMPCVSPDVMVAKISKRVPDTLKSYTIGRHGPTPKTVIEVLSEKTAKSKDLSKKTDIYAQMGVGEYVLVDPTGELLPERLMLKRLRKDGTWEDCQDADGGVTSALGFRIVWDFDGRPRVVNTETGQDYPRPVQAWEELLARQEAEKARLEAVEARQGAERALQKAEQARLEAERLCRELEVEIQRLRKHATDE